jgi:hypothetical protein
MVVCQPYNRGSKVHRYNGVHRKQLRVETPARISDTVSDQALAEPVHFQKLSIE